ncbi:hypothetical protein GX48_08046 [Paracoccidioides brasiliensis]|nr:hypothetical protein GX48_08046 [Paracoccidioides brasiliensis]
MSPGYGLSLYALQTSSRGLSANLSRISCPVKQCPVRQHSIAYQRRNFHPSRPTTQIISTSIECAHDLLQLVHTYSGLPWVASIPLTAAVARIAFGLPFHMWSMSQRNKKILQNPAIIAYTRMKRKSILNECYRNKWFLPPRVVSRESAKAVKQFQKALYRRHGLRFASFIPFAPLLQLPFWLAFMESIRSMSGWQPGLLVILQQWISPDAAKAQVPVELSLSTEGAFWLPDLTASDPLHVLPFAISALMFTHITWGSKICKAKELPMLASQGNLQGIFSWAIQRTFQVMSIWIAPALMHSEAPAALGIYWLTTTSVAIIQSRLLKKFMPPPTVPKPCERKDIERIIYVEKVSQVPKQVNL